MPAGYRNPAQIPLVSWENHRRVGCQVEVQRTRRWQLVEVHVEGGLRSRTGGMGGLQTLVELLFLADSSLHAVSPSG